MLGFTYYIQNEVKLINLKAKIEKENINFLFKNKKTTFKLNNKNYFKLKSLNLSSKLNNKNLTFKLKKGIT